MAVTVFNNAMAFCRKKKKRKEVLITDSWDAAKSSILSFEKKRKKCRET